MRRAAIGILLATALAWGQGRRSGAPGADLDILQTAVASIDGTLRSLDKKKLLIELSEEQSMTIEVTRKTEFVKQGKTVKAADLEVGVPVTVEAKKVANQLVAVRVRMR